LSPTCNLHDDLPCATSKCYIPSFSKCVCVKHSPVYPTSVTSVPVLTPGLMRQELAATVAESASASADDAAVEVTRLRQCLECKESELEIMQGWLSKGEQATKVSVQ